MSYQSEILADTPVLYYRLDQSGGGTDGETVPDLSGNGLHATLDYGAQPFAGPALPNQPAWGHVSPIETDAASREFWGWVNAVIGGLTGTSNASRASDAAMTVSGDFTVEEWLRPMADIPLAGSFPMANKQGTGGVTLITGAGSITHIGGFCIDTNGTTFTVHDPTFDVAEHLGESFHVVVVRLGNALAVYINGTLRNVATVTSGLPTQFTSSSFHIHPPGLAYTNARHDEVAFYNYALSAVRVLAHYEAALNVLNMRGSATIHTSAQLNGSEEPAAVKIPFRHNWSEPVVERLRWRSSVFVPTNGATQLARQRSSPRRQVEYTHLLMNEQMRRQFQARAFAGRTAVVQFEPDKVLIGDISAGAAAAAFDTTYRDFEVGQPAYIWESDTRYEVVSLTTVSAGGVEWGESLSRDYTNAWIKPARTARLSAQQEMELQTDTVATVTSSYDYLEQDEPLSPNRCIPWVSTLLYRDREVFDLAVWQGHDYSELPTIEFTADRSELDESTGIVSTKTYRWGAQEIQPYNMNLKGRELIAQYLGWLYERAGMSNPFWMPTFRQDLKPISKQGEQLTVAGHEYTDLYAPADSRIDLAFVYFDNTVVLRRIISSDTAGDDDLLYLDANVPTLTNVRYLSFLRRVILDSDDLELAWVTDDVVRVAFAVRDAPLDWLAGSVSASPSPSLSTSQSPSPSHSPSTSVSPSGSASPSHSASPSV